MHGDLCKHLGIDLSIDHPDRYSNLFLNAYINRHLHAEYLINFPFKKRACLVEKQHVHLVCWENLQICLLFTLHLNHVIDEH